MTQYEINLEKARYIASYTRGKLKRLDVKKGKFDFDFLSALIPVNEDAIGDDRRFRRLDEKKPDAFFTPARRAWMDFFRKQTGLEYRFLAADGQALKQIGKYLKEISGDDETALEAWRFILQRWNRLPEFYKKNPDIRFINSQLNKIVNELKNGRQQAGKGAARSDADALRRRFQS